MDTHTALTQGVVAGATASDQLIGVDTDHDTKVKYFWFRVGTQLPATEMGPDDDETLLRSFLQGAALRAPSPEPEGFRLVIPTMRSASFHPEDRPEDEPVDEDYVRGAVAGLLRKVAAALEGGEHEGAIFDVNGVNVGTFALDLWAAS